MQQALRAERIRYVHLGDALGGRPADRQFYDERERVRYDLLAQSAAFGAGIERLVQGADRYRVAVMCSEENPARCHRRLLVGRALLERGIPIRHIRGDGSVAPEVAVPDLPGLDHPSLFAGPAVPG